MKKPHRAIAPKLIISLGISLIVGCAPQNPTATNPAPASTEPQLGAPAIDTEPTPNPYTNSQTALSCRTAGNFADITWQQGRPKMTFGSLPDKLILKTAPVRISGTAEQTIYTVRGETVVTAKVYPNGTCALRVVSANGTTTVNESGKVSNGSNVANQSYQTGFDRGYKRAFKDGQNFRKYGSGYNPDGAFAQGAQSGDPTYDQGFQRGFYAGFDSGYYSGTTAVTQKPGNTNSGNTAEPNQDNLSMACTGSIQDRVDFTAYYNRESGFNRVEFRPRASGNKLTSNLLYQGKNDQGYAIWRGTVQQMADVALVHLSTSAPQKEDEVSVSYDTSWGRATCR